MMMRRHPAPFAIRLAETFRDLAHTGSAVSKDKTDIALLSGGSCEFFRTCRVDLYRCGITNIARQVEKPLCEGVPEILVEGRILQELLNRFMHSVTKLVVAHGRTRNTDDSESRARRPSYASR